MPIIIKTPEEIELMRKGGKILAEVLEETCKLAKPGISTLELDKFAEKFIKDRGGIPSFKGYHGFPGTLCTSINEEIVHGIPKKDRILQEGDLLTIDCGVTFDGLITDAARSIGIGTISKEKEKLIKTAYLALSKAIDIIKPGIHIGAIGRTVQRVIEKAGFHVIRDLTGHGVGKFLHEAPTILNYYEGIPGATLEPGMTLAIEPIFSAGTSRLRTMSDKWTLATIDNSCAVQAENTIVVNSSGCEILTIL
ncbi:MAG: type I methionyl aminopeptidase [Candidatus Gracilibacteria bacterium]|jgi:methionyl aminopeptidase